MKKLLFLLLLLPGQLLWAQSLTFKANTGDAELDANVSQINADAKLNFSLFKNQMSVQYNISENKIESLRIQSKMEPGDIFLALEIGKLSGKNIDEVVKSYEKNKGKGWGAIAKDLGIKPGSKEFHALKGNSKKQKDKGKGKPAKTGKDNAKGNSGGKPAGKGKSK